MVGRFVRSFIGLFIILGTGIDNWILGQVTDVKHLQDLFNGVTNTNVITRSNLEKFLSTLHLEPHSHDHGEHEDHGEHGDHVECYSAEQMLNFSNASAGLDIQQFHNILPTIVYEITNDACHLDHQHGESTRGASWQVIIATIAAVLVISASGVIVVALLPMMPPNFYNVVTQFLIALSVGSLIGDAFLHLIPHALSGAHDHAHESGSAQSKEEHLQLISKSLVAVLGVYLFFLTERLTILYQNKSSKRRVKRELVFPNDELMEGKDFGHPDNTPNGMMNRATFLGTTDSTRSPRLNNARWNSDYQKVDTGLGTRQSSFVNAPGGTVTDFPLTCEDKQLCNRPPQRPLDNARCADHLRGYLEDDSDRFSSRRNDSVTRDLADGAEPLNAFTVPDSTGDPKFENQNTIDHLAKRATSLATRSLSHDSVQMTSGNDFRQVSLEPTPTGGTAVAVLHDEESEGQPTHLHRDRPHGHHHGHSHDLSSISAIAYTVIVGDGLHNFCDGIAIGAAFADSLEGGLSTSIAVLCHELPHEVGDFAVLLHAGISAKSAILCNLLSSFLCACGTAIGLSIGRFQSVDSWLFMLTAGMFVYIAMVDMMPELATSRLKGHRYCHRPSLLFVWQNLGILLGCGIMLLIALFEGRLL